MRTPVQATMENGITIYGHLEVEEEVNLREVWADYACDEHGDLVNLTLEMDEYLEDNFEETENE